MVALADLADGPNREIKSYRLVNSKFPPIALFDDVASQDEFEVLYEVQAMTNPRLLNEMGRLDLLSRSEIPFGITGCSYATAPFTHVNPEGSRFGDGSFGVLYLADTVETAIAEVRYHQEQYWSKIVGLSYDRFVFRGLVCSFDEAGMKDATVVPLTDPIYSPIDYSHAQALGREVKATKVPGLRYNSVRSPNNTCWGLMTPRSVKSIIQTSHYEMVWNNRITGVNKLSGM